MNDKSVLYSLSRSLPERERRELLEKINRSLSLKDRPEENIHRTPVTPEERKNLIELEIAELDWLTRFILWISGLLNGKPRAEAFQIMKLNEIRKRIRRNGYGLIDFQSRQFNVSAARQLFSLYQSAYPLIPFFRKFWHDPSFFGQMVMNLLEKKVHEPKSLVTDVVSLEEMKRIYRATERKEDIRNEILRKLKQYINDIPQELFQEIESGLLPLYYLKNVVLFNYYRLFSAFHGAIDDDAPDKTPEFKPASAVAILDPLEELYYAIYTAQKTDVPIYVHPEIFDYYYESLGLPEKQETGERPADGTAEHLKRFRTSLRQLAEGIERFHAEMPLAEIIKYFRADPYYRMLFYLPTLKLKEFYHYTLRVKILSQFEDFFTVVRSAAVEESIAALFDGNPLKDFYYYRETPDSAAARLGLPRFAYIKTLTVMNNFLLFHYRRKVLGLLETVNRILAGKKRDTQTLLMTHVSGLEDLIERIRLFDLSLSPESEDGKTFFGVQNTLEGDTVQQRMYQNLVSRKDKEAQGLYEKGIEHIDGLQRALEDALTAIQNINSGRTLFGGDAQIDAVEEQVALRAREIARFRKLIVEVRGVESSLF